MKTQDEIFQKTLLSLQHSVPPQLRAGGSRGESHMHYSWESEKIITSPGFSSPTAAQWKEKNKYVFVMKCKNERQQLNIDVFMTGSLLFHSLTRDVMCFVCINTDVSVCGYVWTH